MESTFALEITRQGVQVALLVSLPILAVCLFLGLLVSVLQALTQIQEATLSFAPKVIGVGIIGLLMGHWMLITLVRFLQMCLARAAEVVG